MSKSKPTLHPEIVRVWGEQEEYADPLQFLREVYLMRSPPNWAKTQLKSKPKRTSGGGC